MVGALIAQPLRSQQVGAPARVVSGAPVPPPRRSSDGRLEIGATVASGTVRLDGVLDDAVWAQAVPVGGFVQSEPHEGQAATEATDVRVAFDGDNLYIGATMHDATPAGIVVNDIRKDFYAVDQDVFEVILDTFGDRRNGYIFSTNVEGARRDVQVANEGRETNESWDAVWDVRTRRTADGWTAEMAIPFRVLRFRRTGNGAAWGINFSRRIRRRNEIDFWAPVPRSYNLSRVSLAGNLVGLTTGSAGRDLRVKPYVAGRTVRDLGGASFANHADAGVDAKYGITPSLTLDVTANPDFAQVEADEQQVNLTQFSQFLPEKRDFFLENSGIFYVGDQGRNNRVNPTPNPDEDLLLFFSRRIGLTTGGEAIPIFGGARLTGHVAGLSLGALDIQTKRDGPIPADNYSVLRVRRNLFAGSDVGVVGMQRQATDSSGDYNRLGGVDANIRLFGRVDWSSFYVRTVTPGQSRNQFAERSTYGFDGDFFHSRGGLLSIGDGFNDELGFYRRAGVRKWFTETGIRPRPVALQRFGIREMHPHIGWDYYTDQAGEVVGKNLHTGYTFFLSDGGYVEYSENPKYQRLTAPFEISPGVTIPISGWAWDEHMLRGSTDASRMLSADVTGIAGGLWSGTQRTFDGDVNYKPSYHFRVSVGIERTAARLNVPAARFTSTLWTTRANYSFTPTMFIDALSQYDPEQKLLDANVRFDVIHHPLSDLYIVYNESRIVRPLAGVGTPAPGRSVIVKFTQMAAF